MYNSNSRVTTEYYNIQEIKQVRSATPQGRHQGFTDSTSLDLRPSARSSAVYSQTSNPQSSRSRPLAPQVAVFLMAVEITRLRDENETLYFRLKQNDDRIFALQNYEQQINDLKKRLEQKDQDTETIRYEHQELIEKNTILELEITKYREINIQHYNLEISKYREEIEYLRLKLRDFEEAKISDINILREQWHSEAKLEFEKKLQERNMNQEYQREYLEGELRKWREHSTKQQKEIDDLKNQLQQRDLSRQRELEFQIQQSRQECEHVKKMLQKNLEEAEEWKRKYLHCVQKGEDYDQLEAENTALRDSHLLLEGKIDEQSRELELYHQDVEKLRQVCSVMSKDLESQKMKNLKLEKEVAELQGVRKRLEEKERQQLQEFHRLEHIARQKSAELEQLRKQFDESQKLSQTLSLERSRVQDMEKRNIEFESRYKNLLQEIDKVNKVLSEKEAQLAAQKKKTEGVDLRIRELETELQQRMGEIEQLKDRMRRSEIEQSRKLEESMKRLGDEIDRLQAIVAQQEDELRQWRYQYAEEGDLLKKQQELLCNMFVLIVEVESLRSLVRAKEVQEAELRRSSLAPYKGS